MSVFSKFFFIKRDCKMSIENPVSIVGRRMISNPDFVKACVSSKTARDVADKLGVSVSTVSTRAKKLRAAGVAIPEFEKAIKVLDISHLNSIIEEAKENLI